MQSFRLMGSQISRGSSMHIDTFLVTWEITALDFGHASTGCEPALPVVPDMSNADYNPFLAR
jgi:hypothetical protein